MEHRDIAVIIMTITALILAITVHEWAHAITADLLGDDTPRRQGRVTLWPLAHLDPIGTICMIATVIFGVGLGWGKPVESDPNRYRINWRLGWAMVAGAGPFSNLILAVVFGTLLRTHLLQDDMFTIWTEQIVLVNISLFLFNLLPIYPLDGGQVSREVCGKLWGARGRRISLQVSFVAALAIVGYSLLCAMDGRGMGAGITAELPLWVPRGSIWTAILFGLLAMSSYQMLQMPDYSETWDDDRPPWSR